MRLILASLLLFAGSAFAQTTCTTTLNAGAAVGTAISSAAAGSTICLNNGNYAGFTLSGVTKSPRVTVRAVNSRQASFTSGVTLTGNTNGITISGVNFNSTVDINGQNTREITLEDFNGLGQIWIESIQTATPNILLQNFSQIDRSLSNCSPACIHLEKGSYTRTTPIATIRAATIDGGCADGFRMDTSAIIENSYIANKQVGNCGGDPHVDAVQFYGGPYTGTIVRNNYFYCNVQVLAAYDGVNNVLIENNVFDPGAPGCGGGGIVEIRPSQIEWYADTGSIIRHNTLINRSGDGGIEINSKGACGSGTVVENNIAAFLYYACAPAVSRNNLVPGASSPDINGSPTFSGTCTGPKSLGTGWRGCELSPASLGNNAATDGTDVGTAYFGGSGAYPNPPTGVTVTDNDTDHLGWFASNWGG